MPDLHTPFLTYDPSPRAPGLALPAGACDSHVHVFGPADRYPYGSQSLRYAPPLAPLSDYLALAGVLAFVLQKRILEAFWFNPLLNGLIGLVLASGKAGGGNQQQGGKALHFGTLQRVAGFAAP